MTDIITPLVGLFLPAGDLAAMQAGVTGVSGTVSQFKYGDLIANIIDFVIIALIVFMAYKQLSRYKLLDDKTKPAA